MVRYAENTLAAILIAIVWLVPNHQYPWRSFHHEMAISVVLICALGLAFWQGKWRFPLSYPVAFILLCALVPWVQWAAGLISASGQAFVVGLYLLAVAAAFALGEADATHEGRLSELVFGALILAAMLNVPVQVAQWYQWYSVNVDSLLMLFVTPLPLGSRPSGLILQPNQLATIYVWALIALTYFAWRKHFSVKALAVLSFCIHVGLGLTQSRTGLIEVALVTVLLVWAAKHTLHKKIAALWTIFFILQLVWAFNFEEIAKAFGAPSGVGAARLTTLDSVRLDGWLAFGAAVISEPWVGFGLGEVGHAYTTMAYSRPDIFIGTRFAHAHNALLDVILWVGIPLGLLVIGAVLFWLVCCLRLVHQRRELVFPLGIVASFSVHSMLELPHYFLYFLVPVAMYAGYMNAYMSHRTTLLPPRIWGLCSLIGLASASAVAYDYLDYQERYTEWRYEAARVGSPTGVEPRPPLVLNQIYDELALYRLKFDDQLDDRKLDWVNRTAAAVASPAAYHVAAMANVHLGYVERGVDWMSRLNAIISADESLIMEMTWRADQARLSSLGAIDWPAYRGKYRIEAPREQSTVDR